MSSHKKVIIASSISKAIAPIVLGPSFIAYVHTVLQQCIHLVTPFCKESLVTITLAKEHANLPNGIMIAYTPNQSPSASTLAQFTSFIDLGITKGMECRRIGQELVFSRTELVIQLEPVQLSMWEPRMPVYNSTNITTLKERNSKLMSYISKKLIAMSMDSLGLAPLMVYITTEDTTHYNKVLNSEWRTSAVVEIKNLVVALAEPIDIDKATESLTKLVHMGSGETYSSVDSFLVGLYALLWATSRADSDEQGNNGVPQQVLSLLKQEVEAIITQHRQISLTETELIHAARGNFSEINHILLEVIVECEPEEAIEYIETHWESISADSILGVVVGIQILCNDFGGWVQHVSLEQEKYDQQQEAQQKQQKQWLQQSADSYFYISKENRFRKLLGW